MQQGGACVTTHMLQVYLSVTVLFTYSSCWIATNCIRSIADSNRRSCHGCSDVTICMTVPPKLHTSAFTPNPSCRNTSGAMNAAVPHTIRFDLSSRSTWKGSANGGGVAREEYERTHSCYWLISLPHRKSSQLNASSLSLAPVTPAFPGPIPSQHPPSVTAFSIHPHLRGGGTKVR